ncbi:MAG: 50S ribosomal protein L17 [Deltaproteobacteria bacterium]|nr:50S ribosomal protein L17 [Deltaproteobacteria bacterium]
MRHRLHGRKLNRSAPHRKVLFRNMATSLILHGRIATTQAKAKELRRVAERLVTLGKRYRALGAGTAEKDVAARKLHLHRQMLSYLMDKKAVESLMGELAERFEARPGGYTRILKIGPRRGDAAPMALIEFLAAEEEAKEEKPKRRRRRAKAKTADETPAAEKPAKAKAKAKKAETAPAEEPEEAPAAAAEEAAEQDEENDKKSD